MASNFLANLPGNFPGDMMPPHGNLIAFCRVDFASNLIEFGCTHLHTVVGKGPRFRTQRNTSLWTAPKKIIIVVIVVIITITTIIIIITTIIIIIITKSTNISLYVIIIIIIIIIIIMVMLIMIIMIIIIFFFLPLSEYAWQ
jgi:hypothetical protein